MKAFLLSIMVLLFAINANGQLAKGRVNYPPPLSDTTLIHLVVIGQSQAEGFRVDGLAGDPVTTITNDDWLTLDGSIYNDNALNPDVVNGEFIQCHEDTRTTGVGDYGETIATSMMAQLDTLITNEKFKFCTTIHAQGGRSIQELTKGGLTGRYEHAVDGVARVRALSLARGWHYNCHLIWYHGGSGLNTPNTYQFELENLVNSFRNDVSEYAENEPWVFAGQQRQIGNPDYSIQVLGAANNTTRMQVATVRYIAQYESDNIHLTADGTRQEALLFASAIAGLYTTSQYQTLQVSNIDWFDGNKFRLQFPAGTPPISGVAPYGIEVFNVTDNQVEPIQAISIDTETNSILITPTTIPITTKEFRFDIQQGASGSFWAERDIDYIFTPSVGGGQYISNVYAVRSSPTFTFQGTAPPNNIFLSEITTFEGNQIGDQVSQIFFSGDGNATYTLESGQGSNDNGNFTIVGDKLNAAIVFDYDDQNLHQIRLGVTTSFGSYEKSFVISVREQIPPTSVSLSSENILEGNNVNDLVATISSDQPNTTFTLVSGAGDTDNANFNISGNSLRASKVFNSVSDNNPQEIRIRATNNAGFFEQTFLITIDAVTPPTVINISNDNILENLAIGQLVGNFSTDATGVNYSFQAGTGGEENTNFTIDNGNQLRSAKVFDFDTDQNPQRVRISASNTGGNVQQNFLINITEGNAPTFITLPQTNVAENNQIGDVVSNILFDGDNPVTLSFDSGTGGEDNANFTISNNQLLAAIVFDNAVQATHNVRITATNIHGAFTQNFVITVVDEVAPTSISIDNDLVIEFSAIGTVVGLFSSNASGVSYQLVSGGNSSGNQFYTIVGNELRVNASIDWSVSQDHEIRVEASNGQGANEFNLVIWPLQQDGDDKVYIDFGTDSWLTYVNGTGRVYNNFNNARTNDHEDTIRNALGNIVPNLTMTVGQELHYNWSGTDGLNNSGVASVAGEFPSNAWRDGFFAEAQGLPAPLYGWLTFDGLDPTKTYTFELFGTRAAGDPRQADGAIVDGSGIPVASPQQQFWYVGNHTDTANKGTFVVTGQTSVNLGHRPATIANGWTQNSTFSYLSVMKITITD